MSCEEEHADLVGDFLVGEAIVGDGVDGFHEAGEDVLGLGRTVAGLFESACDDFGEDGADGGGGFSATPFWEEGGEFVEAEDGGFLCVGLEIDERFVDGL